MRPYKALFGGATNDPSVRHSLDVSVSVAEGYDDNVLANRGGASVSGPEFSGLFTSFVPGLDLRLAGRGVQFTGTASSSLKLLSA